MSTLTLDDANDYAVHVPETPPLIEFYEGDDKVGTLMWEGGMLRFDGKATESACIFLRNVVSKQPLRQLADRVAEKKRQAIDQGDEVRSEVLNEVLEACKRVLRDTLKPMLTVWAVEYKDRENTTHKVGVAAESLYGALKTLCGSRLVQILRIENTGQVPMFDEPRIIGVVDWTFRESCPRWDAQPSNPSHTFE